MTTKTLNIVVPFNWRAPDILNNLAPEENAFILSMGTDMIKEARSVVAGLSQKEIYNKIKEETKGELKKLETDLLVQKELNNKIEEGVVGFYEKQLGQLKKQIETMNKQLNIYDLENSAQSEQINNKIKISVEKERERFEILLKEKDLQNKLHREAIEKLQEGIYTLTHKEKSNTLKGSEGEKEFNEYAKTFIDFPGFKIIDKHTQGGEGDFHLHFQEFDVLVDAKKYKNKVPINQREKIQHDLIKNAHINFAWLVSLNNSIDKWDRSPIMYEWINTSQCVVYINNLSSFEDPQKMLRIVWFSCKELCKLIDDKNVDNTELTDVKEKNFKLMSKVKNIRKIIREINTSLNGTKNLIQTMDDELRGILEVETSDLVNSKYYIFDEWWGKNVELTNDEIVIKSTDLWTAFKQDNKTILKDLELTTENFKEYIKSKIPLNNLILRSNKGKGAYDIKGIQLKQLLEEGENLEKIDIELSSCEVTNKKKIKNAKEDFYFDEKIDKQIIKDYESKDIMILSLEYKVKPWEIISLLMKHNILTKREQAKGYNKYKETDEYKNKLKK